MSLGFTLIECLIASLFLSVTVLGLAGVLAASSQQGEQAGVSAASASLARELMEQIASRPFDPPTSGNVAGWPANTDKQTFDDLADFNGYTDTLAANSLATPGPAVLSNVSYVRTVAIQFRATPAGTSAPLGDFAMITVTVTPSTMGAPISLHRLTARYPVTRD